MSVQKPYVAPGSVSQNGVTVTVVGVSGSGEVMVRDAFGYEFSIDGNVRLKGMGLPLPGENWVLNKIGNVWVFEAMIGAPEIGSVTGSQEGLHPVLIEVIAALKSQGLLIDDTTPVEVDPISDPATPDPPDPADPDAPGMEDPPADHDPVDDPEPVPDQTGPPADEPDVPDDTNTPSVPDPSPSATWLPLYLGTYNTFKDLGPATAYADLLRLNNTKLHVVGLQEAHANERDGGFDRLESHGWSHYRPKTSGFVDENTIIWRTARFDKLDQGSMYLDHYTAPGHHMPPRYLVWVKLYDKKAHRPFYFMDTHLDPHLEHGGHPYWNLAWDVPRIHANINMIDKIAKKMKAFGATAPVFTAGDWNIDYFGDNRVRYSGYPVARFGREHTRSNWATVAHHPGGGRFIDQIWGTRLGFHGVKHVDHWILSGYKSDHRPVMAKYLIRGQ